MTKIEKLGQFIMRHATQLLLLAVVLTMGAAMRTSAFAKYNSYLFDKTNAVSGDFFVTSNYLAAETPAQHAINFWDGDSYEIPVRVRNFENSLRYNHEGVDFFYTVDAAVYKDEECQEADDTFEIKVYYGDASNNGVAAEKTVTDGDGKTVTTKYGLLKGSAVYSAEGGEQTVSVASKRQAGLSPLSQGDGPRYLKVVLHTVPLTQTGDLEMKDGVTYSTDRGVYYAELTGIFILKRSDDKATVDTEYHTGSAYSVSYSVMCNSGDGDVKVYYPAGKVVPDSSLGVPALDGKGTYVTIAVTEGQKVECYFFKKSMDVTPSADEFFYELNSGIITDDTTHYTLTGDPASMIKFLVGEPGAETQQNWALSGSRVVIELKSTSTHVPKAINAKPVSVDFSLPVTPVEGQTNQYQFQMPKSNVKVSISFRYTTAIVITPDKDGELHGSIAVPAPADVGDTVSLSVAADSGYELDTLVIKNGADTVESVTLVPGVSYSFTMPEGAVVVTASFKVTESGGGGDE